MSDDSTTLFLGIDIGTSGIRAVVVDGNGQPLAQEATALAPPPPADSDGARGDVDPETWWEALLAVLDRVLSRVEARRIVAMALDGTSGTVLTIDERGDPSSLALMYNDVRARDQADRIGRLAPTDSGAHGPQSSVAKVLWLAENGRCTDSTRWIAHQADFLAGRLCARPGISDENNALKLGYDVLQRRWPDWLEELHMERAWLPQVLRPGADIGTVRDDLVRRWGLSPACMVRAGTTDSIAGLLATGVSRVGDAVTALGSTMVLKVISDKAVFAPESGVYSHRLGDHWLVGGASNTGGAVLSQFFCPGDLQALTEQLDPDQATGLDYYPLPAPGERFPVNDPDLKPRLSPRPRRDDRFFQGMLEGMARIEARGYRLLAELGAPYPRRVLSTGGGAHNAPWLSIRARTLGLEVIASQRTEACLGAARLAMGPPTWE